MIAAKTKKSSRGQAELRREIERIEALVEETRRQIRNPAVSLPQRMRLNLRRVELEAYAKGIRYTLGEVDQASAPTLDPELQEQAAQIA